MVHDVDDIAVWCSHEEPAYAPRLGGQRVHDLVSQLLCFCIGGFNVVGENGDDRVLPCGCVAVTSWTFAVAASRVARMRSSCLLGMFTMIGRTLPSVDPDAVGNAETNA